MQPADFNNAHYHLFATVCLRCGAFVPTLAASPEGQGCFGESVWQPDRRIWNQQAKNPGLGDTALFFKALYITGINTANVTTCLETDDHKALWDFGSVVSENGSLPPVVLPPCTCNCHKSFFHFPIWWLFSWRESDKSIYQSFWKPPRAQKPHNVVSKKYHRCGRI